MTLTSLSYDKNISFTKAKITEPSVHFQEIGWYDDHKNAIGVLLTRLATDASQIKGVCLFLFLRFAYKYELLCWQGTMKLFWKTSW